MNKWIFLSIIVFMICAFGFVYLKANTVPTISFFPLDEDSSFSYTNSSLKLQTKKENNSYRINWTSESTSNKKMYLRQDASLLYDNGRLRGVRSKWVQDTAKIQVDEELSGKGSSFFQVISFHHGEIHTNDTQIKSIHHMSHTNMYVIDSARLPLVAFTSPENSEEKRWKKLLERTTKQQLLIHWSQLSRHFNINLDSYLTVPLTNLFKYNKQPLPSMSQEQTDKIIGQLWEGLYKNYVIPAANTDNDKGLNYIPIILFDKQQKHLLVLFELNGKKQKLIQKYSN